MPCGRLRLIEQERGQILRPPTVHCPLGGWEPASFVFILSTWSMKLFIGPNGSRKQEHLKSVPVALFPLVDQVGSHDLTLVNLHLATLSLPGGENPSKNHGDSHRLASFAQTLQETLKGRTLSFPVSGQQPHSCRRGEGGLFQASLWSLRLAVLSTATHSEGAGDGHTPAPSGARPPLCLLTSLSLWAENAHSTVSSCGSSLMKRIRGKKK